MPKMKHLISMNCLQRASYLLLVAFLSLSPAGAQTGSRFTQWTCGPNLSHQISLRMEYVDREIDADMSNLSAFTKCSMSLYAASSYVDAYDIHLERKSSQIEACGEGANTLTLVTNDGKEVSLMCGNEMAEVMRFRSNVKLEFYKASDQSKLLRFNIFSEPRVFTSTQRFQTRLKASQEPRLLYSPFYPSIYTKGAFSVELDVPRHQAVFFQFRFLEVEYTTGCHDDSLRITGGIVPTIQEYKKFCGYTDLPAFVLTEYNSEALLLDFEIDSIVHGRGFELEYHTVKYNPTYECNNTTKIPKLTVSEATYITFSVDLETWKHSAKCGLNLIVSGNKLITLTNVTSGDIFNDLCERYEIEVVVGQKVLPKNVCQHSSFSSIRGKSGEDLKILISAKENYSPMYSRSGNVIIGFVVDTAQTGIYPDVYYAHTAPSYVWIPRSEVFEFQIHSPVRSCTKFSALNGAFQPQNSELGNLVKLYSGALGTTGFELTADCLGRRRMDSVIDNGRSRFTTAVQNTVYQAGYWFSFSQSSTDSCKLIPTNLVTDTSFTLRSVFDFYGNSGFKPFMACKFVIPPKLLNDNGTALKTQFKGSLKEDAQAEMYVKEGSDTDLKLVDFKRRESSSTELWYYSDKVLYLYFTTGSSVSQDLASFQYKAKDNKPNPGCHQTLTVSSDLEPLVTPNYPNHLESDFLCQWNLKRHPQASYRDYYIHVLVQDLSGLPCDSSTKLYIQGEGDYAGHRMDPVCGKKSYYQIFQGNAFIRLQGGPDNVIAGLKFEVEWKKLGYLGVCGRSYNIDKQNTAMTVSGTFQPGHFLIPLNCQITFYSNNIHEKIKVHLNKVKIRSLISSSYCSYNKLIIYDGDSKSSRKLIETCYNDGEALISTSNQILLEVDIRAYTAENVSFSIAVEKAGVSESCNGDAVTLFARPYNQYIESPGYPGGYHPNDDCRWKIASNNEDIEIEFMSMDLEQHRHCDYDTVEVYDGPSVYSPVISRLCHIGSSGKFRGKGREMLVRFTTDSSGSGEGFRLRYYTKTYPSVDLENAEDFNGNKDDNDQNDSSDDGSGDQTGMVIGACLSAIVGVFGLMFVCVWVIHKRRLKAHQRRERIRREQILNVTVNGANHDSSVFVINPLIMNNAAPPPPYPGIINEGFSGEEPPPSYRESLHQLSVTVPSARRSGSTIEPPPPPYSADVPQGHAVTTPGDNNGNEGNAPTYDNQPPGTTTTLQPMTEESTSSSEPTSSDYHLPAEYTELETSFSSCSVENSPNPDYDVPSEPLYSLAEEPVEPNPVERGQPSIDDLPPPDYDTPPYTLAKEVTDSGVFYPSGGDGAAACSSQGHQAGESEPSPRRNHLAKSKHNLGNL